MLKLLGETGNRKEIEAVVREADNNGDGTVDFEGRKLNIQCFHYMHKHTHSVHLNSHEGQKNCVWHFLLKNRFIIYTLQKVLQCQ